MQFVKELLQAFGLPVRRQSIWEHLLLEGACKAKGLDEFFGVSLLVGGDRAQRSTRPMVYVLVVMLARSERSSRSGARPHARATISRIISLVPAPMPNASASRHSRPMAYSSM